MLNRIKKSNKDGFTIIEVMIVLAIAGLILLIVFLAVPALQRSSRNTQRKNDAAGIGAAIANEISNNGGATPTGLGKDADATTLDVCATGGAATGGTTACSGNLETSKMGFYTPANVSLHVVTGLTTPAPTTNTAIIEVGENCNAANTGAGTLNTRTAAIFYATESGSGGQSSIQCVEQ
jgi:prepilin-type N-terminal cleavage/methylation domain-containing protein